MCAVDRAGLHLRKSKEKKRQNGNDVGTQYRSGIYFYTPEQEKAALESMEKQQKLLNRKIVTEILPAKKFYRAEEYHQQYLSKGGRFGFKQSAEKASKPPHNVVHLPLPVHKSLGRFGPWLSPGAKSIPQGSNAPGLKSRGRFDLVEYEPGAVQQPLTGNGGAVAPPLRPSPP
ncbi:hypothetical protein Sjap_020139 [Stephania japonica]|uniref:peptide-methionine (S)-S-oxide reductase n=1 Tax=Stephania japonica TaxID=461633 RepID=A0AAP0I072_9MAGN